MSHEIILTGCSPIPLASYLKALGILRLVAAQDEDAKGFWRGEHFVLQSRFETPDLTHWFLNSYEPTPIISPWNGRAGFLEGVEEEELGEANEASTEDEDDNSDDGDAEESTRKGAVMLGVFADEAAHKRFASLRNLICAIHELPLVNDFNVTRSKWKSLKTEFDARKKRRGLLSEEEKERLKDLERQTKQIKARTLEALRNSAPEHWLEWFDACQALVTAKDRNENKVQHTPLLGKGGVDGSMDFGVNYLSWLNALFDVKSGQANFEAGVFLSQALFGNAIPGLMNVKPGQFNPGGSKSPNSGAGFEGQELDNPWNYIFTLEGSLFLAGTVTKRLQSNQPELSFPFSVLAVDAGTGALGSKDAKTTNTEIWLPLWRQPVTQGELKTLFAEGRATVGRKAARNSLEFTRAISLLGINRGISHFQRYGFLKRAGKSFIAAPLNRFTVSDKAQDDLMANLDKDAWLDRLRIHSRGKTTASRFVALFSRLENALFDLTQHGKHPPTVQAVLIALGEIQQALAASAKARESVTPVPVLPEQWVIAADDQSIEFRIACALASLRGSEELPLPLRAHMTPVHPKKNNAWKDAACKALQNDPLCRHRLHVWHHGRLVENLSNVMNLRLLLAQQLDFQDKPLAGYCGCELEDVGAFLAGSVNDERIAALAAGLALCRMPENLPPREQNSTPLPAAYLLLKALFTQDSVLRTLNVLSADKSLPIPPGLLRLLQADRVDVAIERATRRLRASGVPAIFHARNMPSGRHLSGLRLAACLVIPLSFRATARLVRSVTEGEIEGALETATSV